MADETPDTTGETAGESTGESTGEIRRGGRAMPSWTLLGSVTIVAVAVLTFLITASPDRTEQAVGSPPAVQESPSGSGDSTQTPEQPADMDKDKDTQGSKQKDKQQAKATAYVEVFNNSGITGLASTAADELGGAGWDVVGTDDWYGDIPESTVYYPQRLRGQAALLAGDLGADRIKPAIDPMRLDRLTVILTGDL